MPSNAGIHRDIHDARGSRDCVTTFQLSSNFRPSTASVSTRGTTTTSARQQGEPIVRKTLIALSAATGLFGLGGIGASATTLPIPRTSAIQQVDWYCGPRCEYWQHRRWEERHGWSHEHRRPYYGYSYDYGRYPH
jgi:hypothetical protein